ncbi:DUF402 domain-containing protein [Streptomyces sp. NPDC097617]|uniref:DUF402 domain-containing protein n=1 Tax=Streptomyces sp. NPDC097617 TaxID=3366091 RepID=UPI0037FC9A4C
MTTAIPAPAVHRSPVPRLQLVGDRPPGAFATHGGRVAYLVYLAADVDPVALMEAHGIRPEIRSLDPRTLPAGEPEPAPHPDPVRVDDAIRLDRVRRLAEVDGRELDLTYLEFELLAHGSAEVVTGPAGRRGRSTTEERPVRSFEVGRTVVRRDVHRSGRVWSEQALRVLDDSDAALVTACAPGAEVRWPALYARARDDRDRSARTDAFDEMATGAWELAAAVWQETDLLLWKPPAAWFSVNAFYIPDGDGDGRRLWNWYVNFERPTVRTAAGFDTFDLTVDLVIAPDLSGWEWKDEDEYAHVRRLGIVSDAEHEAVDAARDQILAMLAERSGVFADAERWAAWRWEPTWPTPYLGPAAVRVASEDG